MKLFYVVSSVVLVCGMASGTMNIHAEEREMEIEDQLEERKKLVERDGLLGPLTSLVNAVLALLGIGGILPGGGILTGLLDGLGLGSVNQLLLGQGCSSGLLGNLLGSLGGGSSSSGTIGGGGSSSSGSLGNLFGSLGSGTPTPSPGLLGSGGTNNASPGLLGSGGTNNASPGLLGSGGTNNASPGLLGSH